MDGHDEEPPDEEPPDEEPPDEEPQDAEPPELDAPDDEQPELLRLRRFLDFLDLASATESVLIPVAT